MDNQFNRNNITSTCLTHYSLPLPNECVCQAALFHPSASQLFSCHSHWQTRPHWNRTRHFDKLVQSPLNNTTWTAKLQVLEYFIFISKALSNCALAISAWTCTRPSWERGLTSKELAEEKVFPWHVSGHAVHVQHREAWLVIIYHVPKRKVFLFWENGEKWHLISRHHSPLSNSVLMALSESDFSSLSHVILQILEWKYWFRYYVCQYTKGGRCQSTHGMYVDL